MKSQYENLPDSALFRFLKILMKEVIERFVIKNENDLNSLPKSSVRESVYSVILVLRKYGLDLTDIDINYFWTCLLENKQEIYLNDKLTFNLKRPKLKVYEIVLEHWGSVGYTEDSSHKVEFYNIETAKDVKHNEDFNPFDGEWGNYEIHDSEHQGWRLSSIEETDEITETHQKRKKIITESFNNQIENLDLYELVDLKEIIENKISKKLRII